MIDWVGRDIKRKKKIEGEKKLSEIFLKDQRPFPFRCSSVRAGL